MSKSQFGDHECSGPQPPDPCLFCNMMAEASCRAYRAIGETAKAAKFEKLVTAFKVPEETEAEVEPARVTPRR